MIYIFTDIFDIHKHVSAFYQLHMVYLCFEVFPHLVGGCTPARETPPTRLTENLMITLFQHEKLGGGFNYLLFSSLYLGK